MSKKIYTKVFQTGVIKYVYTEKNKKHIEVIYIERGLDTSELYKWFESIYNCSYTIKANDLLKIIIETAIMIEAAYAIIQLRGAEVADPF